MFDSRPFRPEPGDPTTVRHSTLHCPTCGSHFDAVSAPDGSRLARLPQNGDLTVCWYCTDLLVYLVGPLGVACRIADAAELEAFQASPYARRWLAQLQKFKARKQL